MGLTGGPGEIWAFVIERDAPSREIYGAQLCPIYTKSISDKATASRATRKRKHGFMWGNESSMTRSAHAHTVCCCQPTLVAVVDFNTSGKVTLRPQVKNVLDVAVRQETPFSLVDHLLLGDILQILHIGWRNIPVKHKAGNKL